MSLPALIGSIFQYRGINFCAEEPLKNEWDSKGQSPLNPLLLGWVTQMPQALSVLRAFGQGECQALVF